jgi:hypothetical protein
VLLLQAALPVQIIKVDGHQDRCRQYLLQQRCVNTD